MDEVKNNIIEDEFDESMNSNIAYVQQLESELKKTKNDLLYVYADMDNMKKNLTKQANSRYDKGIDTGVQRFLSVFEDLRRAVDYADGNGKCDVKGIELIARNFMNNLTSLQVEEINPQDKDQFDDSCMTAVGTFPTDNPELKNKVATCSRSGWKRGDNVLLYAEVIVYYVN